MLRHRCKAGNHEVHEPANTDADRAANARQGDLFAEQAFHHSALFFNDYPVGGGHDKLAATILALVILLAVVYMAIFLELLGSTLRTRLSHAHGHLRPPTCYRLGIPAIHIIGP